MSRFEWIQIIASFLAGGGFAMLFRLRDRQLPLAATGSALTWLICLAAGWLGADENLSLMIASVFGTLCAILLARVTKVPKTVYLFPFLIPLVPGSGLYRTMRLAIDGNADGFLSSGVETLVASFSIAFGITAVLVGEQVRKQISDRRHGQQKSI